MHLRRHRASRRPRGAGVRPDPNVVVRAQLNLGSGHRADQQPGLTKHRWSTRMHEAAALIRSRCRCMSRNGRGSRSSAPSCTRTKRVPDATVTRWLFALLHFRALREHDAAADLMRWWARLEADEESAYFGLRNEARGAVLRGTVGGAARRRWRASTRARSSNSGKLDKRHCRAQGTQNGGETSKLLEVDVLPRLCGENDEDEDPERATEPRRAGFRGTA